MLGPATSQQRANKANASAQGDQAHQAAIVNVLKATLGPLEDAKVRILLTMCNAAKRDSDDLKS